MATSLASRGSSALFNVMKLSTFSKIGASHAAPRLMLSNNFISTRPFSDAASGAAMKQEYEILHDEKPIPTMKAAASPAVSSIQDVSSLQRLEKCINMCQLMGRVGSEPQLRGSEQHPVLLFSMATHTQFRDETGALQQKTFWHRVAIFKSGLRETCFKYCRKGQRIFLTGEIQYSTVKDPETNYVRTVTSIIADDVVMLGSPSTAAPPV